MSDNSKDVMAIVDLFEQSDWDELHIELDGLHLFLSRNADARLSSGLGGAPAVAAPAAAAAPAPSTWTTMEAPKARRKALSRSSGMAENRVDRARCANPPWPQAFHEAGRGARTRAARHPHGRRIYRELRLS